MTAARKSSVRFGVGVAAVVGGLGRVVEAVLAVALADPP
jgi:hypothetical protein